mmetsp:Transcript_32850/g.106203  ORF Transcript_32850/g.106203 Transcript_32850/m.106203 type:complete len:316 (-) Transcript_32850:3123-4070(-)
MRRGALGRVTHAGAARARARVAARTRGRGRQCRLRRCSCGSEARADPQPFPFLQQLALDVRLGRDHLCRSRVPHVQSLCALLLLQPPLLHLAQLLLERAPVGDAERLAPHQSAKEEDRRHRRPLLHPRHEADERLGLGLIIVGLPPERLHQLPRAPRVAVRDGLGVGRQRLLHDRAAGVALPARLEQRHVGIAQQLDAGPVGPADKEPGRVRPLGLVAAADGLRRVVVGDGAGQFVLHHNVDFDPAAEIHRKAGPLSILEPERAVGQRDVVDARARAGHLLQGGEGRRQKLDEARLGQLQADATWVGEPDSPVGR